MPAITIKLESDLVEKAAALKQPDESVAAFVRSLVEKEYRISRLHKSAQIYNRFLHEHPDERNTMAAWESASLSEDIESKMP